MSMLFCPCYRCHVAPSIVMLESMPISMTYNWRENLITITNSSKTSIYQSTMREACQNNQTNTNKVITFMQTFACITFILTYVYSPSVITSTKSKSRLMTKNDVLPANTVQIQTYICPTQSCSLMTLFRNQHLLANYVQFWQISLDYAS